MIRARSGEEQCLGTRTPAIGLAFHQQRTDCFCAGAPARFTGCHDSVPARTECIGQRLKLGRFADALSAFKGDEFGAHPPKNDIKPAQTRPKKPASETASSATSGMTCGAVSGVVTTRSAMCWPLAIGALIGPS